MSSQAPFTAAPARQKQRVDQTSNYATVKQEQKTDQDLLIPSSSIYTDRGNHAQDAIELSDSDSDTPRNTLPNLDTDDAMVLGSLSSVSKATIDMTGDRNDEQHIGTVESSKLQDDGGTKDTGIEESITKPPKVPDMSLVPRMMSKDDASGEPRLDTHDKQPMTDNNDQAKPNMEPRIVAEHDTAPNIGDDAISMLAAQALPRGEDGDYQGKANTQECGDQAVEAATDSILVTNMNLGDSVIDETSRGTTALPRSHELAQENSEDLQNTYVDHCGDQTFENPVYRASVAYMGPRTSPNDKLSLSRPFTVDSIQVDGMTASAKDVGLKVDTESLEAASDGKTQKAQEILSEMGRLVRETKRKREIEKLLRRSREEKNIVGRKPHYTVGPGQKVLHGNDSRMASGTRPAMGHTGPSGLQIGLASLGIGNPDILRQIASNQQESISSELPPTDEEEFVEPSMDFNSTGVGDQKHVGRVSAADLFVRGSTASSLLGTQQVSSSESDFRMQFCETTPSQSSPSTTKSGAAKKRVNPRNLPTCIDECSEADRMLLYSREVEVRPWADILASWRKITGQEIPPSTIHARHKRLKANLREFKEDDASIATNSHVEKSFTQPTGGASRISKKRPHGELSITDYFDRHDQRVKALKAEADPKNRGHGERSDKPEESLFLNSDSDNNYRAKTHPKTGAKGLSTETLKKLIADTQVYPTPSQSEIEPEELDFPRIIHEYHVTKRIQFEGQPENEARTTGFGPYYTIAEANAVAATKARQPNEANATAMFRSGAWSYSYGKDDVGMESHRVSGEGGTIEAWVTREVASSELKIGIPLTAFTTPAWMYIAMISLSKQTATDGAHVTDSNEVILLQGKSFDNTIIKACSLLDLANRAASREWIKLQSADIPNDGLGHIARAEMEMHMRHDLEQMDEDNVAFDRTYRNPASGLETHIWVEMVEVEGPRN